MKKLSTTLAFLSFLFAIAAVVIALLGTISLRQDAQNFASEIEEELIELDEKTEETSNLPEGYELNEDQEAVSMSPEDLGFRFVAPNEWGAFDLNYTPGHFKGSGLYKGTFSEMNISFFGTDPNFVEGRGGYYADTLGYRESTDGFEMNMLNLQWFPIPENLVQGEVETSNGFVLVVSPDSSDGPSAFGAEEGSRFAIANFKTGPLPGGVFLA